MKLVPLVHGACMHAGRQAGRSSRGHYRPAGRAGAGRMCRRNVRKCHYRIERVWCVASFPGPRYTVCTIVDNMRPNPFAVLNKLVPAVVFVLSLITAGTILLVLQFEFRIISKVQPSRPHFVAQSWESQINIEGE